MKLYEWLNDRDSSEYCSIGTGGIDDAIVAKVHDDEK